MKKLLLIALVLCWPGYARADAVVQWNETALRAAFAAGLDNDLGCVDPLHESRMLAMMHVAVHDALNAIVRRSRPYAFDAPAPGGASPDAAVAAAAHDVLVATFPALPPELGLTPDAAVAMVEAGYGGCTCGDPSRTGQDPGDPDWSVRRRSHPQAEDRRWSERDVPGFRLRPWTQSRRLPADSRPLVRCRANLGRGDALRSELQPQYRPPAPYDLGSRKYAADFKEVKSLGAVNSVTRTNDQTEIARFWVEGSPQGWNRIARTISARQGLDLWQNARLFGLLNLASADAYIVDFENKTSMNSGAPSARSAPRIPTAIRGRPPTQRGIHWSEPRRRPTIPPDTAGREGRCRRSSRDSSATRSASRPPARHNRE